MLKYDTVHGRFNGTVSHDDSSLTVNGETVKVPPSASLCVGIVLTVLLV